MASSSSVSSSSRLSQVANERRRQRKQQKQQQQQAAATQTNSHDDSTLSLHKNKYLQNIQSSCNPTESLTFDDSTITSSSQYSLGQSTIQTTEDTFNFAIPTTVCDARSVNTKGSYRPSVEVSTEPTSMMVVTTPRRRNAAYQRKLDKGSGGGSASVSSATSSCKKTMPKIPESPSKGKSVPYDMDAEVIKMLTNERDKLARDIITYKRKLVNATEAKNTITKEKQTTITNLEQQLTSVTKELELSKGREHCMEQRIIDETKKVDETYRKEMTEVQQQLEHVEKLNQEMLLMSCNNTSIDDESLNIELENMKKEKMYMESKWMGCMGKLKQVEMECQEMDTQKDQLESQLNQTIQALENKNRALFDTSKQQQTQLTKLFADKQSLEKSYQDQIADLQSQLNVRGSSCEDIKQNYNKVVEGLKADLVRARQLHDESKSRLQQDISIMKAEHEENLTYYKNEVDSLQCQLRSVKIRGEAERKDWAMKYEDKLHCVEEQRDVLSTQVVQSRNDIETLKSVHEKDTQLLESELDKTYKAKVEFEAECKDVKHQLHNALRSLDVMASDGDKMRLDLESMCNDFSKEKSHYQQEISHLKNESESLKSKLNEATRRERSKLQQNTVHDQAKSDSNREQDELLLEIQHLRNKLEKAQVKAMNDSSLSEYTAHITQLQAEKLELSKLIAEHSKSAEAQRIIQRETSAELSRAKQTIQILKSKERYLESRVESLAAQISQTVRDYEMRLTSSLSGDSMLGRG